MQLKLILAVLGAAFLSIGVFSPFLTIPVAGGISLFNRGLGNGVILLVLAGLAVTTALLRRWNGMWVIAGSAGGVLLYTTLSFYFTMVGAQEAAKIKLADNPFGGLGEALLNAVQISWGLPMMVIGVILLATSAGLRDQAEELPPQRKPILPILLGLVALVGCGIAGAVSGQQERTTAVNTAKAEAARAAEAARQAEEERRREEEERAAAEAAEAQARQEALNNLKVDFDWRSEEYSRYLVGTVVNESDRVIHNVAVKFTLTDEDKNLVGDAADYVDSIAPGQTWSFEAYVFEDRAVYARLSEVTGRAYEY